MKLLLPLTFSDFTSWEFVNQDFQDKFKPLQNKSEHEYWMALEDFRCNFGGVIIVSSTEPYKQDGSTVQRQYKKDNVIVNGARINRSFHGMQQESERAHAYKEQCKSSIRRNSSAPAHSSARADTQNTCSNGSKENSINFDMFITDKREIIKQTGHVLPHPPRRISMQDYQKSMYVSGNCFTRRSMTNRAKLAKVNKPPTSPDNFADITATTNSKSTCNSESTDKTARTFFGRKASVGSVLSEQSTSDICLHFNSSNPSETVTWRPQSAPNKQNVIRKDPTVSMSTLVKNSFLAKRTDHFRSDGSWHLLLYHKEQWLSKYPWYSYDRYT